MKNELLLSAALLPLCGMAGEVEGEKFKQWCMSCHNPSAITTGLTRTSHSMNDNSLSNTLFEKDAKTLVDTYKKHGNSRLEEGVSCLTCHRITEATSQGNASYSIELTNRKKYPFEDDESTTGEYLGHKFINAKPNIHKESYMKPLYKDSKYCASCHDETSPITNKQIVSTFKEWEASPYNNKEDKTKNKSCISCFSKFYFFSRIIISINIIFKIIIVSYMHNCITQIIIINIGIPILSNSIFSFSVFNMKIVN
jgi:hypothetical protein